MTYYILFEHTNDPYGRMAVEVQEDRYDIESAQLIRQQDRADAHNKIRAKSYRDGLAVGRKLSAADFKDNFSIQEVQQ